MRKLISAASFLVLSTVLARAQGIEITRNASAPSTVGDNKLFSGHAVVDPLFPANAFTHGTGGLVTFAPGARTAWHTHPAGQMLIVTSGKGWVQQEGSQRQEINPGDVVWIQPGVNHWHGATDKSGMSHIAISYMKDGKNVEWGRLVTGEEYAK
ncbi:cupin domain-containing protein [Bosea sp. 47.2.35]|jgi:quercetin dioxygenase-like cupin family protein|uniref:(R)-mandelonitrile lyase n=1 Tax=Bosea sp. 47.2.35 TaxID=2969304 RepID=UPI00215015C0|nr:cupin domain-containing protein [Bosea sp. 47.2.35]MCR4524214.1 cupin domain-containing protein [Bosea sp. 47.2.35]